MAVKHCFRLFWSFLFLSVLAPLQFSATELKETDITGTFLSDSGDAAFFSPFFLGGHDPFAKIFEESNPGGKKESYGGDGEGSLSSKPAFLALRWVTSLQECLRNRVKNTVRVPLFVLFHSWKSFLF